MVHWLRFLTVDQWRAIDKEYMDRPTTDWRVPMTLVVAVVCLILARYYGRTDFLIRTPPWDDWIAALPYPTLWPHPYWGAFKALNYLLVPMLYIHFVLRERIVDFGFKVSLDRKVWLLYGAMFAIVFPLTYGASWFPAFAATYPKYKSAGASLTQFFSW